MWFDFYKGFCMISGGPQENLPQGVCVLLLDINKKCVLVSRPDGKTYGLPGGKLEAGEDFADAAMRELWEETGLTVQRHDLLPLYRGVCDASTSDGRHYDVQTFVSLSWGGQMEQKEHNIVPSWGVLQSLENPEVSPFSAYNKKVTEALGHKFPSLLPPRPNRSPSP